MKLMPIEAVRPSTYNPREADPRRLALVELSLRKLGWLLPVYASPGGELSSGHQRHHVATQMGLLKIPVETIASMPLADRKAVNVVFNRATNDLRPTDTSASMQARLSAAGVLDLAEPLPDLDPTSDAFYGCLHARTWPVNELVQINEGRWIQYARNLARTLQLKGIRMPIVVRPSGLVINGIGRLQLAAERREQTIPAVIVPEARADFAEAMLNYLSMDFDLETRYADLLRHNSFRRARRARKYLGRGFTFAVIGRRSAKTFDIHRAEDRAVWQQRHGTRILDFGAGHLHETHMLREAGFDVTPFEPYHLDGGSEIDKRASLRLVREFLEAVASGKRWSSIFIASVLNSVPFAADRAHLVTLCAALATRNTTLYACASNRGTSSWLHVAGEEKLNETAYHQGKFRLDYEPGITVGDLGSAPKVQKYHTKAEFKALFGKRFTRVEVSAFKPNVYAICRKPRRMDLYDLAAAIQFEFDLPYPDGSRMGMVEAARAAFERRLGDRLPQPLGHPDSHWVA